MTAPHKEIWALCGGATHAKAPADALRLSVGDNTDSMTAAARVAAARVQSECAARGLRCMAGR